MTSAVTSQPASAADAPYPDFYDVIQPNGTRVRTMMTSDSQFVTDRLMEAFGDKIVHAAGQRNKDHVREFWANDIAQKRSNYRRIFLAEIDGHAAGVMVLRFHGDHELQAGEDYSCSDWCGFARKFGCWPTLCMWCLAETTEPMKIPQGKCYLANLAVNPEFRGRGVGKTLMGVGDEMAVKNGCGVIYLYVSFENRAKNLYEREGYVEVGEKTGCIMRWSSGVSKFHEMVKTLAPADGANTV